MRNLFYKALAATTAGLITLSSFQLEAKPRLIILLQEGLGHELLTATRQYSEEKELWDWRLDHNWTYASVSTLPLTRMTTPDGTDPEALPPYDALSAWDGTLVAKSEHTSNASTFAGYKWLIENATDRMQAATAIGSGIPSFNTAINWLSYPAKNGSPLPPTQQLIEWAHYNGLKTGIISDMPFSHETNTILAGVRAESDKSAFARFNDVYQSSPLDLYVAAGHPKYNALGQALSDPKYTFCSQSDWQELRSSTRENGWNLIFGDENLMGISTKKNQPESDNDKRRLVILQFGDTTSTQAIATDSSGLSANLATSLRFQANMALDYLNQSENGFALIVHMGRLPFLLNAELQKESLNEVLHALHTMLTIEEWVDANGGWAETSLVLMSPYEYGLLWGSDSSSFPFSQVTNRGKKRIPGYRLNHKGPTASLAPILIRGSITKAVKNSYQGEDPIYGHYLPSSSFGDLMKRFVSQTDSKVE